ncbi:MAG: hypothetical protein M1829_002306 [Trizodia sp. TS-e1964]|nr:MAG: hypothetical protein M1829_002306 [Trizodia sp. TS-e1964]
MPWVVPSAEVLYILGELKINYIWDGIDVEWTNCVVMGSTKPKPDYVAALSHLAYTADELDKLEYCSVGFTESNRQNIHSACIAVKAIFDLYEKAFSKTDPHRLKELNGKILVFSVSHNHEDSKFYGHYAVPNPSDSKKLVFYRKYIKGYNLAVSEGEDVYKAYNFVFNIYEKFAPQHLRRIKDALANLPNSKERTYMLSNNGEPVTGLVPYVSPFEDEVPYVSPLEDEVPYVSPFEDEVQDVCPLEAEVPQEPQDLQSMPSPARANTDGLEENFENERVRLNARIAQLNVDAIDDSKFIAFLKEQLFKKDLEGEQKLKELRQEHKIKLEERDQEILKLSESIAIFNAQAKAKVHTI